MMNARKSISILSAVIAATTLSAAFVVPTAGAAESEPVTSVRSFKGQQSRTAGLLKESTSVEVNDNANYGGIESLNVPKTESKAEKEAKAKAVAEKKAAEEAAKAAAEAAAQAASRSSERTSTSDSSSSSSASTTYSAPTVTVPASANGSAAVSLATQYLGVPYAGGPGSSEGYDPATGLTCSGLTWIVYTQLGLTSFPKSVDGQRAWAQSNGTQVSDPQPGDFMWLQGGHHVAIYVGGGKMIHAPYAGQNVRIDSVNGSYEYYRILK